MLGDEAAIGLVGRGRDVPGVRIELLELDLVLSYGLALRVEDEEPGGGGSVVDGADKALAGVAGLCLVSRVERTLRRAYHLE
jgi:hypothetical protein